MFFCKTCHPFSVKCGAEMHPGMLCDRIHKGSSNRSSAAFSTGDSPCHGVHWTSNSQIWIRLAYNLDDAC